MPSARSLCRWPRSSLNMSDGGYLESRIFEGFAESLDSQRR
jgi:hypothetical protein